LFSEIYRFHIDMLFIKMATVRFQRDWLVAIVQFDSFGSCIIICCYQISICSGKVGKKDSGFSFILANPFGLGGVYFYFLGYIPGARFIPLFGAIIYQTTFHRTIYTLFSVLFSYDFS